MARSSSRSTHSLPSPSRRSLGKLLVLALQLAVSAAPLGAQVTERILKSPSSDLTVLVRETTLGFKSSDIVAQSFRLANDGRGVAYATSGGGSITVHLNNEPGEAFEGISVPSLKFSPDGKRLVYIAFREEKQFVVLDGEKFEHVAVGDQGINFSADSSRAGWVAQAPSGKQIAVIDGEEGPEYDGIAPDGVTFSSDGAHSVYLATQDGRESLVLDGTPGPFLEDVLEYWWSPVGSHLGYVARDGGVFVIFIDGELVAEATAFGKNGIRFARTTGTYYVAIQQEGRWSLLVDGEKRGNYAKILPDFSISNDGRHYAMLAFEEEDGRIALIVDGEPVGGRAITQTVTFNPGTMALTSTEREDGAAYALIDGKRGPAFERIDKPGVFFSSDGAHYAYSAWRGGQRFVVLDGETLDPMERFGPVQPLFLPTGSLLYTARVQGRIRVVVDGQPQVSYDQIGTISRSLNGERYGYVAEFGDRRVVVIDGEEQGSHPFVLEPPTFSDDGERFAYVAGVDRKLFVVLDGVPHQKYDYIMPGSLSFTPDSEHLVYLSAKGTGRYLMIDDVQIENDYTGFSQVRDIKFASAKEFTVRASRDDKLILIDCEIQ